MILRVTKVHDAGKGRGVERINNGLSFSDVELGLAVGEGGGNGTRVRECRVLTKRIDGASFGVFPDVVIWELQSHP